MTVQMSLRIPEDLADQLRLEAGRRGISVNRLTTDVLRAAFDPENASTERERTRERLRRAGLLAELPPPDQSERLDPEQLAAIRRALGRGKPLSEYIVEEREARRRGEP